MTARVLAVGTTSEGTWSVPFVVEERRVPKAPPNKMFEVPLQTGLAFQTYLRRLGRAGWWPDRVRLQALLEPHPGSTALQTVEDTLEVQR